MENYFSVSPKNELRVMQLLFCHRREQNCILLWQFCTLDTVADDNLRKFFFLEITFLELQTSNQPLWFRFHLTFLGFFFFAIMYTSLLWYWHMTQFLKFHKDRSIRKWSSKISQLIVCLPWIFITTITHIVYPCHLSSWIGIRNLKPAWHLTFY